MFVWISNLVRNQTGVEKSQSTTLQCSVSELYLKQRSLVKNYFCKSYIYYFVTTKIAACLYMIVK